MKQVEKKISLIYVYKKKKISPIKLLKKVVKYLLKSTKVGTIFVNSFKLLRFYFKESFIRLKGFKQKALGWKHYPFKFLSVKGFSSPKTVTLFLPFKIMAYKLERNDSRWDHYLKKYGGRQTTVLNSVKARQIKGATFGSCDYYLENETINLITHHDSNDINYPDVANSRIILGKNFKSSNVFFSPKRPTLIDSAVSLIGAGTNNYAHWILDHLPKLLLANEINLSPVILVDDLMPQSHYQSINLLKAPTQKIRVLREGEVVFSEKLTITPNCSTTVFDYLNGTTPKISHALFDGALYKAVAEKIRTNCSTIFSNLPKRLFLTRKNVGSDRQIINNEELSSCMEGWGFTTVNPADLTIEHQVQIFSNCEFIVAQNGAAMANIIFCKSDTIILGITAFSPETNIYYFSNLAHALSLHFGLLLSKPIRSGGKHPGHYSFSVDIEKINEFLSEHLIKSKLSRELTKET